MTRKSILWAALTVVVILRLYLTGDRDILALNSPHDEYWYIESAFNRVWGGPYNEMTLIHLPVYSMWLAGLKFLGIPARLAIDVGWLLASGYLAYAIHRLTRAVWPGLLLFVFLAFHPYIIRIFDRALAETLLTVLSAAVLAAGIEIWNRRAEGRSVARSIALWTYGIGFALAYHTRTEGIVLLVPVLLLACWSVYDRRIWWRNSGRLSLSLPLLVTPLLGTLLLGCLLAGANYVKWGVWATQELAAPGYKSAMAALSSIDTGPTPKQITVTREMMALAYRESPTFRELQPAMEGPTGSQWVAIARPYVSAPGEIGNGWFYWALRDVAARTGWHANARLAESKYRAVAAELSQAFDGGRLKKRRMLSSFVDPDLAKWMPNLPRSLYSVARLLMQPKHEHVESPQENASPLQLDRYAAVTGRRQPLPRVTLTGWVTAPVDSLIGIAGVDGARYWQPLGPIRTDVANASGFTISASGSSALRALIVQIPGGHLASIDLAALRPGGTAALDEGILLGIDGVYTNTHGRRAEKMIIGLGRLYEWAGYVSCFLVLAVFGCAAAKKSRFGLILFLVIFEIIARVVLLAILDASSWSGTQVRYLIPLISFGGVFLILGLFELYAPLKNNEGKFLDQRD
jgi:hypothetical protein